MEIAVALRICASNSECPDNCPRRLYPYSSTCASRLKNDAADAITDLLNRPPVEGLSSDARLLLLYCPEVITIDEYVRLCRKLHIPVADARDAIRY